jgi:monoamine oxidase
MTRPDRPTIEFQKITRRHMIGSTFAGVAALTASRIASAGTKPTEATVDVVIVGAGFSGLAAARKIAQAGWSVLVLEARDRVGGKVLNHSIGHGQITEAGATYIGPTQNRMAYLADQYKVPTYPTYHQGNLVTVIGGNRVVGGFSPALTREYHTLTTRLNTMSAQVPVDNPAAAAHAVEWDSQTLYSWLKDNNASSDAMEAFSSVADLWGAETRDVSLLFALYYIASAGDKTTPGALERLLDIPNGAQELRFQGGSQVLAQRIAAGLGDRVVLSAPVRQIDWSDDRVVVTADGHTVEAKHVIIAMAPALAAQIQFAPQLSTPRAQFLQRYPMGSLAKVEAVYDQPFWRSAQLSGQSVLGPGPVRSTFDNTPPSGNPGILIGFVGGSISRLWSLQSAAERRAAVLADFAEVVGKEALDPIEYFEFYWPGEEWSRGGPVGYAGPGVLHDYATTLRAPDGPIHWAGTETATFWNGYMEGAVQAGERAAQEILGSS